MLNICYHEVHLLEDMLISVYGLGVGKVSCTKGPGGGEARFESQFKGWDNLKSFRRAGQVCTPSLRNYLGVTVFRGFVLMFLYVLSICYHEVHLLEDMVISV